MAMSNQYTLYHLHSDLSNGVIQRMVDDFTKAGKKAVAIVCEHKVDDTDKPVVAAFCKVRELYYGGEHKWRPPDSPMNVRQAIDKFRKYAKQHKGG